MTTNHFQVLRRAATGELLLFSGRPSDAAEWQLRQSQIHAQYAKVLRSVGRNAEAEREMRTATACQTDAGNWINAAKALARANGRVEHR